MLKINLSKVYFFSLLAFFMESWCISLTSKSLSAIGDLDVRIQTKTSKF